MLAGLYSEGYETQEWSYGSQLCSRIRGKRTLSFQGRRALARAMKRRKSQLKISRRRAMQKTAGMDVLMKRAEKQARNQLFKKFSKDADRGDLTPQRRAEIEKKVAKAKTRVTTLARKLLPKLRQAAKDRRS